MTVHVYRRCINDVTENYTIGATDSHIFKNIAEDSIRKRIEIEYPPSDGWNIIISGCPITIDESQQLIERISISNN